MDFLNKKLSTFAGIIVLLFITTAVGAIFIYRLNEITEIRLQAIERHTGIDLR